MAWMGSLPRKTHTPTEPAVPLETPLEAPSAHRGHLRLLLVLASLTTAYACGSQGCDGCSTQPIPGGFPPAHRFENAMQVRIAPSGLDFVEQNIEELVAMLVPGGLTKDIPPSGCTAGDTKICCPNLPCSATLGISSATLTPTAPSTLKVNLRATAKTTKIKFEKQIVVWLGCDVVLDTAKAAPPTIGVKADVNLIAEGSNGGKLKIERGTTALEDFDCADISISGSWYCGDYICTVLKGMIEGEVTKMLDDTLDGLLTDLPLGQEGRFDVASFLSSFSPRTKGALDFFLWGGGYTEAESAGLSLGVMGGFRPAQPSVCVPDCERPGAACAPPPKPAIARSAVFRGATRPDGKPFDVGIGVHRTALDQAAYALYSSGALCLDVATQSVSQLSSDLFSLLVPSIRNLTSGKSVPMMLSVRPRHPPTVELGAGTYHQDGSGQVVIDEPLLKLKARDFALEVFLQIDERPVRIFTIIGDLEVPALLYADAQGRLQPMLGALDQALTNIRIENADLITEDKNSLAALFPTLLGVAGSFLGSGFEPIELPSIEKLQLLLDEGSITTTDGNAVLGIFARLGLVTPTSATVTAERVEAQAAIESLAVPPTAAFRLGPGFDPAAGPAVTLRLGARLPPALAGEVVEYAYRLDGGFFHPWTSATRLTLRDPLLWLQGRHTLEVIARVKGRPRTTSLSPVHQELTIDTVAPEVQLLPEPGGVRVAVREAATPAAIAISWSVNGGPFSAFGPERFRALPPGAVVAVRVRDGAGNLGSASTTSRAIEAEAGGCALSGRRAAPAGLAGLLGLIGLLALLISRRRRRG